MHDFSLSPLIVRSCASNVQRVFLSGRRNFHRLDFLHFRAKTPGLARATPPRQASAACRGQFEFRVWRWAAIAISREAVLMGHAGCLAPTWL